MKAKFIYLYYLFVYILVLIFSLKFNYVEGDDASTIIHHALGRREIVQPAYSMYHSMFDIFLSIFNSTNESFLRIFSISISFSFSLLVLILLTYLVEIKFKENFRKISSFFVLLPFIIPDMLFSSLLINPYLISFSLLLLAHILFINYLKNNKIKNLIFSILLFGLGVSFRWNTSFYLFLLIGEFLITDISTFRDSINLKKIKKGIVIFSFYTISIMFFIQLSGYSLIEIYQTYKSGKEFLTNMEVSYLAMVGGSLAFLTPSFIILFSLGIFNCFKKKIYKPLFLFLFALLPFSIIGIYPLYKYLITLLFPILLIQTFGFISLKKTWQKFILTLIVFVPWVIGVQVNTNSSWGPGFDIIHKNVLSLDNNNNNFNPDKSLKFSNIKLVFGSGTAIPTPEGPRPIYGFGKALFNDWKNLSEKIELEKNEAVNYAIKNKINILQDVNHSFISTKLLEKGYITSDPFWNENLLGYRKRVFYKGKDSIETLVPLDKKQLIKMNIFDFVNSGSKEIIIYTSYTNLIVKLKNHYKGRFIICGAYYGILKN